jgi:hypothetical protein
LGCCGDASDFLAQYLSENGIQTMSVFGTYDIDGFDRKYPHAWLQINNGIIIDITGDQFSGNPDLLCFDEPCYVGYETNFHQLFNGELCENYDFYRASNDNARKMQSLYEIIVKNIK